MLGMHPDQMDRERWYRSSIKDIYSLLLFCGLIRQKCPKAAETPEVLSLLEESEAQCRSVAQADDSYRVKTLVSSRVAQLMAAVVLADARFRPEQLQHEYDRVRVWNSSLANAFLQLFTQAHDCTIKDVYFKRSHLPKFERITVFLYDPDIDMLKPPRFSFLPALQRALHDGPEAVANDMVESFWDSMLRHGYFATDRVKQEISPNLQKYFLSGITHDVAIPLLL